MLEDRASYPDSSFSASTSTKGHSPSDARISSGSSWCAPVADGKHYLEVNLRKPHSLYDILTYGDSNSSNWVVKYQLNYTDDFINWKTETFSSVIRVRINLRDNDKYLLIIHFHSFFFRGEAEMLTTTWLFKIYIFSVL